jgi:hypothetical protein
MELVAALTQVGLPATSVLVVIAGGYLLRESVKVLLKKELDSLKLVLEDLKQKHKLELEGLRNEFSRNIEEVKQSHRVELEHVKQANAVELELRKRMLSERYDVLAKLQGDRAEFEHAVDWISKGDLQYQERLEHYFAELRNTSRKYNLLLGDELATAVKDLTDVGMEVVLSPPLDPMKLHEARLRVNAAVQDVSRALPELRGETGSVAVPRSEDAA